MTEQDRDPTPEERARRAIDKAGKPYAGRLMIEAIAKQIREAEAAAVERAANRKA